MVMNLDETFSCVSTRYMIEYNSVQRISTRLMYDDYDLDYTFVSDHTLDEDTYYEMGGLDLDEEYARDTQDYDTLAYRHYA